MVWCQIPRHKPGIFKNKNRCTPANMANTFDIHCEIFNELQDVIHMLQKSQHNTLKLANICHKNKETQFIKRLNGYLRDNKQKQEWSEEN